MNSHSSHKPPRRIIHTSDLHLLSLNGPACQGLQAVVDLALKSEAELLIIAGDLFDQNRIEDNVLDFVRKQICRLPIPVAILPGNHDCLVPESVYNRSEYWQDCTNTHIFRDSRGETLNLPALHLSLWGRPIDTYMNDVRPLEGMPQPADNGSWNILMAHGYF
ncbi:MAG: metallophosphoesterase, partial [Dehalococcoidales bacterium]|nr:metallophosphoesterase [Dehalococcoidales bacterium]